MKIYTTIVTDRLASRGASNKDIMINAREANGPRSILPNIGNFLSKELNKFQDDVTSGLYEFPSPKDSYVKTKFSAWAGMKDTASVAERVIRGRELVSPELAWGIDVGDRKLTSVMHLHEKAKEAAKNSQFSSLGCRQTLVPFIGDKFKETRRNIEFCHNKSNIDNLVKLYDIRVIGDYKAQASIVGIQSGGFFPCVKAMCYRSLTHFQLIIFRELHHGQLDLRYNYVKLQVLSR